MFASSKLRNITKSISFPSSKLNKYQNKTNFSFLTINNHQNKIQEQQFFSKNIYKKTNSDYIRSLNGFCFYSKKDSDGKISSNFDKQIKKEIDKADKERERKRKIEEWKKLKNSTYTKDEFENIVKNKDEILLIEISNSNKKKLKIFKKMCLFFNIPVSLFITFFIDSILPTYVPGNKKHAAMWYGLMATDYILFVNGVLILSALANICLNAKFLPKENMIEFIKLDILNKPFVVKESVETIKRTNAGVFSPFNSLKSKATNQVFALKGIGEWKDIKLFNYLFPLPVVRKEKTELRDVKTKKASATVIEAKNAENKEDQNNASTNINENNKV